MRTLWRIALVLAASGCGSDPIEQPDAAVTPPLPETSQVTPSLCTGGLPGSADCPFNRLPLDELGTPGALLEFVMQLVGSGAYLNQMKLEAGPAGLYAERPTLRFWDSGSTPVFEGVLQMVVNLPPDGSITLGTFAPTFSAATRLSLRFDVIGPYRP